MLSFVIHTGQFTNLVAGHYAICYAVIILCFAIDNNLCKINKQKYSSNALKKRKERKTTI